MNCIIQRPNCFIPFIFLWLSTIFFSYGQTTIRGKVQTDIGNPLAFANLLLLNGNDSTLVKGAISDENGEYFFNDITKGQYFVSASMVGFKPFTTDLIELNENSILVLPPIELIEGVELDEVVVTSKKNLYVQKMDRMVINVESSILSAGASALEILERSPGVIIDRQNSSISLVGKSGVLVIINGKQSYIPADSLILLLESMNASNIETIELITTPPANFDAEGNAGFINIVLKERTDVGLNGSYSISAGVGNGTTTTDNISINFRKNRINVFGTYSFLRQSQGQLFTFDQSFTNMDGEAINIFTTTDRDPIQRNHSIRTGLDYQLSDKTILGTLFWANDNKWTMDALNLSGETKNGEPSTFIELLTTERNQLKNLGFNINLKHDFNKIRYLSFDFDHLKYRLENPTVYTNSFFNGENVFLREELTTSDKTTPINITVAKADYSDGASEDIKMDIGLKVAFSDFNNNVVVGTFQGDDFFEDSNLTDISDLKERIMAGYSSIDYSISDKTNIQLGLRYEHTDSELVSNTQGKVVDRSFGELFPTFYLSHQMNDTLGINFSYSRRITRPTFNDLAPFVIFVDPNTFFAGNPAVQPAISNAVKFDFTYKALIFSAQYSIEEGTISRFQSRFDEENERLIFGASNLDRTKTLSLNIGLPLTFIKWWKAQNNITYLNSKIENSFDGSLLTFGQDTFNINHTQSFTIANNLTSEININYNGPAINSFIGTAVLEAFYSINLGVQKKFGERGGTLGFKINDLLDSVKWTVTTDIPEQSLNTVNSFDLSNRTFMLTYSSSFGNRKLRSARERGTGAEEEKQRVQ